MSMFSSKYAIGALALIVAQALVVIIFESVVISYHLAFVSNCHLGLSGEGISQSDLIYHGLFMISQLFQVLLCLDALYQRNSAQLYALVLYDLLVVVYAGLQIYQHFILEEVGCPDAAFDTSRYVEWPGGLTQARAYYERMMRPFEYAILALIPLSFVILSYLSYNLSKNFTWENYRSYSADIQVRNAAVAFAIFLTLLKLDVFFVLSFAAQLIPSGLLDYTGSVGETIAVFILGSAVMALGFFSVYRESKVGITAFVIGATLGVAYFFWRLVLVLTPEPSDATDPYQFTRKFLVFTIVVTIVLLLASVINAIVCFRNILSGIVIFQTDGGNKTFYGQMAISPAKTRPNTEIFDHYPIELDADAQAKAQGGPSQSAAEQGMWTIE